jgi:hypothetical protein
VSFSIRVESFSGILFIPIGGLGLLPEELRAIFLLANGSQVSLGKHLTQNEFRSSSSSLPPRASHWQEQRIGSVALTGLRQLSI